MCCVVRHTMQALPSGQMLNRFSLRHLCDLCASAVKFDPFTAEAQSSQRFRRGTTEMLLRLVALIMFAVPVFGQGTAIQPCPATAAPSPQDVGPRAKLLPVDASVPDDPDVKKMLAPRTWVITKTASAATRSLRRRLMASISSRVGTRTRSWSNPCCKRNRAARRR
jgi:hypothetical protein